MTFQSIHLSTSVKGQPIGLGKSSLLLYCFFQSPEQSATLPRYQLWSYKQLHNKEDYQKILLQFIRKDPKFLDLLQTSKFITKTEHSLDLLLTKTQTKKILALRGLGLSFDQFEQKTNIPLAKIFSSDLIEAQLYPNKRSVLMDISATLALASKIKAQLRKTRKQ